LQGSWYQEKTYHNSYSTTKWGCQIEEPDDCEDGKGLPYSFWVKAVKTIVYNLNRSVAKVVDRKSPQEDYYGKNPLVVQFKMFGFE